MSMGISGTSVYSKSDSGAMLLTYSSLNSLPGLPRGMGGVNVVMAATMV